MHLAWCIPYHMYETRSIYLIWYNQDFFFILFCVIYLSLFTQDHMINCSLLILSFNLFLFFLVFFLFYWHNSLHHMRNMWVDSVKMSQFSWNSVRFSRDFGVELLRAYSLFERRMRNLSNIYLHSHHENGKIYLQNSSIFYLTLYDLRGQLGGISMNCNFLNCSVSTLMNYIIQIWFRQHDDDQIR